MFLKDDAPPPEPPVDYEDVPREKCYIAEKEKSAKGKLKMGRKAKINF
jgi:hypothetical protein